MFNCREGGGDLKKNQIKRRKKWKINVNHSKFTGS